VESSRSAESANGQNYHPRASRAPLSPPVHHDWQIRPSRVAEVLNSSAVPQVQLHRDDPRAEAAAPAGVSLRAVHTLFARLAGSGVDPSGLLREVGSDPALLRNVEARIPHLQMVAIWGEAERASGDPRIALRALELFHGLQIDMLPALSEYLMIQLFASSPDVGRALERLARFYAIVDDGTTLELERRPGRDLSVSFVFPPESASARSFVEFSIGVWSRSLRGIVADPSVPITVELTTAAPATGIEDHERVLGAKVVFGSSRNAISVPERWVSAKLRTSRPLLEEQLERRAAAAIAVIARGGTLTQRVRAALRSELHEGTPTVERTARTLRTSARSLSRHLRDEGTSHGALLDEVRAELAARHLRDDQLSAVDVATLLGFSDASTFNRAFRRWFDCTPAEFRARGAAQ
jgi:AraC-like DNA-binding protein